MQIDIKIPLTSYKEITQWAIKNANTAITRTGIAYK